MNSVDLLRRLDEEFYEPALCSGVLSFSETTVPVEVLALSAHSADLRCLEEIAEDGPVDLAIDGFRSFTGELVRRHAQIIGMVFSPGRDEIAQPDPGSTPPKPQPSSARAAPRNALRRHPRSAVFWSGAVQAGRASIDCIVLNMSAGGAKIKLLSRFVSDGSPIVLHIDRLGGYAGEIVWSEGDMAGVRFLKDSQQISADINRELGRIPRGD